ncbi:MAG TPA: helix-turn-helix domain-containing protein, partial [Acidimicrobiia bacterium]|nr:helix-turn-helix domain-containing protein [Acidimicrobiia bacterium]
MEDIAREAGVSRGSVYRHFPDKDSLFHAVSQHQTEAFLDEMRRRTERIDDLGGQIDEIARMTIEFLRDDPLNAAMARTDPDAFARAITTGGRELLEMSTDAVVPLVEAAMSRGEVRPDLHPRRAAEWITRIVFSLVSTPSVTFDRDDPAQRLAFLREFLVRGLV